MPFTKVSKKNIELSNEYLYKAYESKSEKEIESFISKALDINPYNIEALLYLIDPINDPFEKLRYLESVIEKATEILNDEGYFSKNNYGDFWGLHQTRPYMQARLTKIFCLVDVDYFYQALKECEELITLNKNDNLGIRYILMGIYAKVKDAKSSQKLYKKFNEEFIMFLLPYAISLYNSNLLDKAAEVFNLINEKYPTFKQIFIDGHKPSKRDLESMQYGIPIGQPGEIFIALDDCDYLITKDLRQWYISIYNIKI